MPFIKVALNVLAKLFTSATGFAFKSTQASCNAKKSAATAGTWFIQFIDSAGNIIGGVDCGGDLYVLGNPGPYVQLGWLGSGMEPSVAGGYMLATLTKLGYAGTTVDSTMKVAGVTADALLFFWTPENPNDPPKLLGAFDLDGNFGVSGNIYTTANPKP